MYLISLSKRNSSKYLENTISTRIQNIVSSKLAAKSGKKHIATKLEKDFQNLFKKLATQAPTQYFNKRVLFV